MALVLGALHFNSLTTEHKAAQVFILSLLRPF